MGLQHYIRPDKSLNLLFEIELEYLSASHEQKREVLRDSNVEIARYKSRRIRS